MAESYGAHEFNSAGSSSVCVAQPCPKRPIRRVMHGGVAINVADSLKSER